jgi:hypothetical protein
MSSATNWTTLELLRFQVRGRKEEKEDGGEGQSKKGGRMEERWRLLTTFQNAVLNSSYSFVACVDLVSSYL